MKTSYSETKGGDDDDRGSIMIRLDQRGSIDVKKQELPMSNVLLSVIMCLCLFYICLRLFYVYCVLYLCFVAYFLLINVMHFLYVHQSCALCWILYP